MSCSGSSSRDGGCACILQHGTARHQSSHNNSTTSVVKGEGVQCPQTELSADIYSDANQVRSSDAAVLQPLPLLLLKPPAPVPPCPGRAASEKGSKPSCCHGAAGNTLLLVVHRLSWLQSKKAAQSCEPLRRVSGEQTTTSPRRGRVIATFRRRLSLTKPMRPCSLHLHPV
jgi:hypothetical protein